MISTSNARNSSSSFENRLWLIDKKAIDGSMHKKIGSFICSCFLFLVNSVILLSRLLARRVFRDELRLSEPREINQSSTAEKKVKDFIDDSIERRMPAFSFKYQSSIFEDTVNLIEEEEKGDLENSEKKNEQFVIATGLDNYRFLSDTDFSGFVEEPDTMTFHVHESVNGLEEDNFHEEGSKMRFLSADDFIKPPILSTAEKVDTSINDCKDISSSLNKKEINEQFLNLKYQFFEDKNFEYMTSETNSMKGKEIRFMYDNFSAFDFESITDSSSDGYSVKELIYDSDMSGFLSEKDFGDDEHSSENSENTEESVKLQQSQQESFFMEESYYYDYDERHHHDHLIDGHDSDEAIKEEKVHSLVEEENPAENNLTGELETDTELQIEFVEDSSDEELSSLKNGSGRLDSLGEVHFVKDISEYESKYVLLETETVEKFQFTNISQEKANECVTWKGAEAENKKVDESKSQDFESEELDELWEHQELIEQLKMELKKVRAAGLPTIFEESESPRGIEGFKSFKIDEEFLREDPLDELHVFYKSYKERMRKFDILNYQKMYAMGFLQLKNPLHSLETRKPLLPTIMSHLCQNLLPFWPRKSGNDPSEKLIEDLHSDLETVYVGQTCLSWEFLRWQYEKSRELTESDPRRHQQYNQAADEFQQFQVLVQRFTENEPFQGPRLPNYVKQRCVLRSLLQVPFMKEDCLEDNMEKKESVSVITSEMLEDIMEEAMRVFWEFVKAEKHETPLLLKVLTENNVEVQEPSDYLFMDEIRSNLQKKEKALRDLLRTGNCLVKKFKKAKEDGSNQNLFFSQVDLKLVARVLRMPRISSDQLIWCQKKLSKINFSAGKVDREPSFLLFPC